MPLELRFAETPAELIDMARSAIANGARTIRIEPEAAAAEFLHALGPGLGPNLRFTTTRGLVRRPPEGLIHVAPNAPADLVAVAAWGSESVSAALMGCLDLEAGLVLAPATEHLAARKPLFLISIPKAGTHLLIRLAEALGYPHGGLCPSDPLSGRWYSIEGQDTHTKATDMFEDILRRRGMMDHPFLRSPALFIYRDPRDVLVSEANYYHRPDVSFVHGYMANLSFRERLIRLIDDTWLLGSIRERMAGFAAWLDLPNVIPLSFEELVGAAGGGDDATQRKAVWSVQLKLHAAGRPDVIARQLYDRASPTFHTGQIGSWRRHFDREVRRLFGQLSQDFMQRYGYGPNGRSRPLAAHRETYRRRRLRIVSVGIEKLPILVASYVGGCNIVRYQRRYFAVPQCLGTVALETWSETELASLRSDAELPSLEATLARVPG